MNDKLEIMWKEVVVTYFKVLSWHLLGGMEKNHKKPVRIVRGLAEGKKSIEKSGYCIARNFMINLTS
jgi:hypothetical protein